MENKNKVESKKVLSGQYFEWSVSYEYETNRVGTKIPVVGSHKTKLIKIGDCNE